MKLKLSKKVEITPGDRQNGVLFGREVYCAIDDLTTQVQDSYDHIDPSAIQSNARAIAYTLAGNALEAVTIRRSTDKNYRGMLEVGVETDGTNLRVDIEDDATGIAPEIEDHLFTDLDNAPIPHHLRKRNMDPSLRLHGGKGHALCTLRTSVEDLGGSIGYENKGENQGAKFFYTIPLESLTLKS